jgi:hypothetical protein
MPDVRTTFNSRDGLLRIEVEDDEGHKVGIPLSAETAARLIGNLLGMLPLCEPTGREDTMILGDLQSPTVRTGTTHEGEFLLDVYLSSDVALRFTLEDGQWAGVCREVFDMIKTKAEGRGDNPVQ